MSRPSDELSDIDFINFVDADSLVKIHENESHLLVYAHIDNGSMAEAELGYRTDNFFTMSALIPVSDFKEYLKKGTYYNYPFAELGDPGIWTEGESDEIHFTLGQSRQDNGINAHYFVRSYIPHGIGKRRFPIAQSFIFYHELSEYSRKYRHSFIDELEDTEVICEETHPTKSNQYRVRINRHYLREYLAARKMGLALWTSIRRYATIEDEKFEIPKDIENGSRTIIVRKVDWLGKSKNLYTGELVFKTIVYPYADISWSSKNWSSREPESRRVPMVVKINTKTGKSIESTKSTEFLTPVYFKKELLGKYIDDSRSSVGTVSKGLGHIKYLDQWSITYGLNEMDRIVVWLGDLEKLSYEEQSYWRHFNIAPEGGIAEEFFRSQIEGQWADSKSLERKLLELRDDLNSRFKTKYNSVLFKSASDDEDNEKQLHTAIKKGAKALKPQVVAIAKLFIDSLNKSALVKAIDDPALVVDDKGKPLGTIALLQKFYEKESGFQYSVTDTLQLIWKLRSLYSHTFDEESYIGEIDKYDSRLDPLDPSTLYPFIMEKLIRQLTVLGDNF